MCSADPLFWLVSSNCLSDGVLLHQLVPVQTWDWEIHAPECRPLPLHTSDLCFLHHQQQQPAGHLRVERWDPVQDLQRPEEQVRTNWSKSTISVFYQPCGWEQIQMNILHACAGILVWRHCWQLVDGTLVHQGQNPYLVNFLLFQKLWIKHSTCSANYNSPGFPSWSPPPPTVRLSSSPPSNFWGLMALMVWIWTGSTLDLEEVPQKTRGDSVCSARWVEPFQWDRPTEKETITLTPPSPCRNWLKPMQQRPKPPANLSWCWLLQCLLGREPSMLDMRLLRLLSTVFFWILMYKLDVLETVYSSVLFIKLKAPGFHQCDDLWLPWSLGASHWTQQSSVPRLTWQRRPHLFQHSKRLCPNMDSFTHDVELSTDSQKWLQLQLLCRIIEQTSLLFVFYFRTLPWSTGETMVLHLKSWGWDSPPMVVPSVCHHQTLVLELQLVALHQLVRTHVKLDSGLTMRYNLNHVVKKGYKLV